MKKNVVSLCLLIFLMSGLMTTGCSLIQSKEIILSPRVPFEKNQEAKVYPKEDLIKDIDQLQAIIKREHPKTYRFIEPDAFLKMTEEMKAQVTDPMSEDAFYRLISPVIASIGCNHSYLTPSSNLRSALEIGGSYIPLRLKIIDQKLYVVESWGYPDVKEGDEVIGINGYATPVLLDRLYKSTSTQGDNTTYKVFQLNQQLSYYFLQNIGQSPWYTLDLRDDSNQQSVIELKGITLSDYYRRMRLGSMSKPYTFKILENGVGYLKISDFEDSAGKYRPLLKKSFEQLRNEETKALIIDLRGNSGGAPADGVELLKYITKKPIRYFAKSYPGYDTYSSPYELYDNAFKGKLYILMDGGCSSTTGHVLSLLKYHQQGVLIGEEAGSNYTCNDASVDKTLNITKTRVRIATQTYETAVQDMDFSRGIMPDIEVPTTLMNILDSRDGPLEVAVELALQEMK